MTHRKPSQHQEFKKKQKEKKTTKPRGTYIRYFSKETDCINYQWK
jgi:hypothetical protein